MKRRLSRLPPAALPATHSQISLTALAEGGSMLVGRLGGTVASPDAVNAVSVLVTNDSGTFLLKRPQDFARR